MDRRRFLATSSGLALTAAMMPRLAWSAEFSSLEFFVPAAPGGGWDQTARVMDEVLRAEGLIESSRIDNVGGAGGAVGLPQFVNQYRGDGEAIMLGGMVMIGSLIANKAPVDLSAVTPLARLTGEYEAIVVPAASPHQTLQSLIDALKADPGAVSWGGGSAGGSDHILAGMIAKAVGVAPNQLSYVAFAGGGEALAAILGSQVTCGVSGWSEFSAQVEAGALRALAISAPERVPGLDVPTLIESGVDVDMVNWRGVFGAPDIDEEARQKLLGMLETMSASETWKKALAERGWQGLYLGGDEFAAYVEEENTRIGAILKDLGLA